MKIKTKFGIVMVSFIIALGMVIFVMAMLTGCNVEKRIARKLKNATQLVLIDSAARHTVFKAELQLYPCVNEVLIKSDTVVKTDTTYQFITANTKDTLNHLDTVIKTITKRITVHDSITIVDRQKERLLTLETITKDKQIAALNQVISDDQRATDKATKQINKWLWLFIAALVAFLLSNIAWIYLRIRKI